MRPDSLGIDLRRHKGDVDNIVLKHFRSRIRRNGWEEEEVLAEVYLALEVRNRGKCPFDRKKSSLGHYIYMVADQTMTRMFEKRVKALRIREAEIQRRSAASREYLAGTESVLERECKRLVEAGMAVEAEVLWYLAHGCTLVDVAVVTGWNYQRVLDASRVVREEMQAWADD